MSDPVSNTVFFPQLLACALCGRRYAYLDGLFIVIVSAVAAARQIVFPAWELDFTTHDHGLCHYRTKWDKKKNV